ncbi:Zinc-finger of the MIZ type in Nse subunit domain containing protein [Rhypophila sp. PSN 637]
MPRLLQRSRPQGSSANASANTAPRAKLPPYEEPAFPLNEEGKRALAELRNGREKREYEKHLKQSATFLQEIVGATNDAHFKRQKKLAERNAKRTAQGVTEKTEADEEMKQAAADLEARVSELTDRSEAAIRQVIDYVAELQDEQQVLQEVQQEVNAQKPRPDPATKRERGADDDGDEAEDVDLEDAAGESHIAGVRDILRKARKSKAEEYSSLTAEQRYAENNQYISFKNTWHDAQHPDNSVPLPDKSTWFDEQGRPTKGAAAANDDDDIVIEREVRDLKCPLSLQVMKDPYSNHKCKHTFEKSAIMEFLKTNHGVAKCPVCTQELRIVDLYSDAMMLRRIKRAERERQMNTSINTSDVEEDDDDGNGSVITGRSRSVKKEKRRPRAFEEIDDD